MTLYGSIIIIEFTGLIGFYPRGRSDDCFYRELARMERG
jgi:hypothetical protein